MRKHYKNHLCSVALLLALSLSPNLSYATSSNNVTQTTLAATAAQALQTIINQQAAEQAAAARSRSDAEFAASSLAAQTFATNQAGSQAAVNAQQAVVNLYSAARNDALSAQQNAISGRNTLIENIATSQATYNTSVAAQNAAQNTLTAAQATGTAAQIAAAQAAYDAAAARVADSQAILTAQQAALPQMNANVTAAQTAYNNAVTAYNTQNARLVTLTETGAAAAEQLNTVQSANLDAYLARGNAIQDAYLAATQAASAAVQTASTAANVAAQNSRNATFATSVYSAGTGAAGGGCATGTLGAMLCNIMANSTGGVGIITGFAYMAGLIAGFLAILKLRQHVENPNSVEIWDPIKRFIMAGAFFALPYVATVVKQTIEGAGGTVYATDTGFNGDAAGVGLDAMIVALVSDIAVPAVWIIGWFGWIAGLIFVFIGISRLMQTEQQGPKGPMGIGTVTTFLIAGALFSLNSIVTYINGSIFDTNVIATNGVLQYTDGLGGASPHIHAVISAIIAFSIVLGWVSLARGLFIVRGVSEGNSQASMMAAITHLIGGVLAINLGSVIMAVQNTLGIANYGIVFAGAP